MNRFRSWLLSEESFDSERRTGGIYRAADRGPADTPIRHAACIPHGRSHQVPLLRPLQDESAADDISGAILSCNSPRCRTILGRRRHSRTPRPLFARMAPERDDIRYNHGHRNHVGRHRLRQPSERRRLGCSTGTLPADDDMVLRRRPHLKPWRYTAAGPQPRPVAIHTLRFEPQRDFLSPRGSFLFEYIV